MRWSAMVGCLLALFGCASEERAPRPAPPAAPDPLRCTLELVPQRVAESAWDITAPVFVGGGVLVAYRRGDRDTTELVTRRASLSGELGPEHVIERAARLGAPRLVAFGERVFVTVSTPDGVRLAPLDREGALDPRAPIGTLSGWPEAIGAGPRGLVALPYGEARIERVGFDGVARPPLAIAASPTMPGVQEELVASGEHADLVLRREGEVIEALVLDAGAVRARHAIVDASEGASVARGASGFLVVSSESSPSMNVLGLRFFDAHGEPRGEVVRLAGDGARRYPRAAPLGSGWLVSFWDGLGPSLLRVDAEGRQTAPAMELRSGDERGGHTDARMAARYGVVAITWTVRYPAYGHGLPEEEPEHPGARLAIGRCL